MQLLRVRSMSLYIPPKGTAGFALSSVKGMSLSPLPPAIIKVRVFFMIHYGENTVICYLKKYVKRGGRMSREKPNVVLLLANFY